jgi:hypothetical protein
MKYYQFNANPAEWKRRKCKNYANFVQHRTNSCGTSLSPLSCLFLIFIFYFIFTPLISLVHLSLFTEILFLCYVLSFLLYKIVASKWAFCQFLLCSEFHESRDELLSKISSFSRDTCMIVLRIYDDRERNFLFTLATSSRLIKLTKYSHLKLIPQKSLA